MRTLEERLTILDEGLTAAADRGLLMQTAEDAELDGREITLDGRRALSFGSCSYLGLEMDPRMREAVCDAVMRYGTQFSSSRAYLSAPLYAEVEELLGEMFGGHVLVAPSTTLGHLATMPVLVGEHDAVILDQQVHQSVQMAANQLRTQGTAVEMIRHSRMDRLEQMIARLAPRHERLWYAVDGVYSMFADLAPFAELRELLDRHEQLHLYVDDSHGIGWAGRHGRGPALEALGGHERLIVAGSLNKSFAAAGGALVFPNAELKRRVRTLGGPLLFSGPVQPPMLGAALASARIHLSDELPRLQAALRERMELCTRLLEEFCLPLEAHDLTPIRYVPLGLPTVVHEVAARLLGEGLYTNVGVFPAVPMKHAGVRITLTLHHTDDDIRRVVGALARHVPAVLAEAGDAAQRKARKLAGRAPALRLERHRTIDALDTAEWDALLGDRGTFSAAGLRFLEEAFSRDGRPEDRWDFHYYAVRDENGAPVLATFFTSALWKDDMLASAAVSRRVEAEREEDPYHLTSRTFAMGSLLTEGDHLHLDRTRDWRGALDLLLKAVAADGESAGAPTIVLRDLDAADPELGKALHERGFVRVTMPDSLVLEPVGADDQTWLGRLSERARRHQRREVLPWDETFGVEVLRDASDAELAHLYELYRNVKERSLELNTFDLPRTFLRDMLAHPGWELVVLRLEGRPVAFGAHFVGERHYAPMVVGLDYEYVRSHHSYRQALRQALLRARHHGAERMYLGMGATLEKTRFGAHVEQRVAYVQASDHYSADLLAAYSANVLSA